MGKRTVLIGALLVLGLASAGSATHSPWPDARHGWEVRGDVDTGGLYSTEDGGRHWHLIYPAAGVDIMGFLRTSAAAGVLSIDFRAPEQYWTGDNGRHWTRTRRLPAFWQAGTNLAGKGPALFWSRARVLYQVANWPPHRRRALRLRRVVRVPDGMFTDLAWIPGGVSGAVLRDGTIPNASVARVLLIRHGKRAFVRLRDPDAATATRIRSLTLFASWPELVVLAEDDRGNPVFKWRSSDGGRHWFSS